MNVSFTGNMIPGLPPNQQCQCTEVTVGYVYYT